MYRVARRYEFYVQVARRISKISKDFRRLPKNFEEDQKIFQSYTNEFQYNLRDKLISVKSPISSLVRYGKYATWVPNIVSYGFYDWCIVQWKTFVYIIINKNDFFCLWPLAGFASHILTGHRKFINRQYCFSLKDHGETSRTMLLGRSRACSVENVPI